MTTRTFAGTMIYPNGDPIPNLKIYIKAIKSHPIGDDDLVQWHESEFSTNESGAYSIEVSLGTYDAYCEDLGSSDSKRFYLGRLVVSENTEVGISLIEAMELTTPPYSWLSELREHDNAYHSLEYITVADLKTSNFGADASMQMWGHNIYAHGYSLENVNGDINPNTVGRMILGDTIENAFVRLGGDSDAGAVVPLHQFINGKLSVGKNTAPDETLDINGNIKISGDILDGQDNNIIAGKADAEHGHEIGDVSGLQAGLDDKVPYTGATSALDLGFNKIIGDGFKIETLPGVADNLVGRIVLTNTAGNTYIRLGGDFESGASSPLHQFIDGKLSIGHDGAPDETLDILGNIELDGDLMMIDDDIKVRTLVNSSVMPFFEVDAKLRRIIIHEPTGPGNGIRLTPMADSHNFFLRPISIGKIGLTAGMTLDINGAILSNSTIQGAFKSSDGSAGLSTQVEFKDHSNDNKVMWFENGILVDVTAPV